MLKRKIISQLEEWKEISSQFSITSVEGKVLWSQIASIKTEGEVLSSQNARTSNADMLSQIAISSDPKVLTSQFATLNEKNGSLRRKWTND